MTRKYDAVALGELLIDFTQHGMSEQGNPVFEANPGGAPANVLAMLKKLGKNISTIEIDSELIPKREPKQITGSGFKGVKIIEYYNLKGCERGFSIALPIQQQGEFELS